MRYPFNKFVVGTTYGVKGKYWKAGFHSGVDFKSKNYGGDGKVYPLYDGQVQKITKTGSYGNCVYIKHSDGYLTLYAHLQNIYVKVGQKVSETTVLGIEGTTGNSTGVHLHVEVHKGDYNYPAKIDPLAFIKKGVTEVKKTIKIVLNGKEKSVTAIENAGNNYVKLQDLRDEKIAIGYENGKPTVTAL